MDSRTIPDMFLDRIAVQIGVADASKTLTPEHVKMRVNLVVDFANWS